MTEDRFVWNEYINKDSSNNEIVKKRDLFLILFEKKWTKLLSNSPYNLCQINTGNRLRPQILYLGFLANNCELHDENLNYVVDIGISIELIHKSSLLIDDLVDNDDYRHGKPTFHTINGRDITILYALNLLSQAFSNLKDTLKRYKKSTTTYHRCIDLSIRTMYDMSLGALNELSLKKKNLYDLKRIRDIIHLETSTLVKNSLLLGYYSNGGCNPKIEELFEKIGNACGYIFQVLNDLEPFCNSIKYKQHKGNVNADYTNSKKNIAVAFLYESLSKKEKEYLRSINNFHTNKVLMDYFQKYNVINCLIEEIDELETKILLLIDEVRKQNTNKLWCNHFKNFVTALVKAAKSKLQ